MLLSLLLACSPPLTDAALPEPAAPPPATVLWQGVDGEHLLWGDRLRLGAVDRVVAPWQSSVRTLGLSGGALVMTPSRLPLTGAACGYDLDGDGVDEVVRLGVSALSIDDAVTGANRLSVPVAFPPDTAFDRCAVLDLDADGRLELFASGFHGGPIAVVALSGRVMAFDTSLGGVRIDLAELDGTPGLELLDVRGGWTHDAATLRREHPVSLPGEPSAVGDVDGDGVDELVVVNIQGVTLMRASGAVVWSRADHAYIGQSLPFGDLDGDGTRELLIPYDDAGVRRIAVLDAATGLTRHEVDANGLLVRDGVAFDGDGDGRDETAWSLGGGVGVLDGDQRTWVDRTPALGLLSEVVVADLDGDGRTELIVHGVYGGEELLVVDALTGQELGVLPIPTGGQTWPLVAAADWDGDGDDELVINGADVQIWDATPSGTAAMITSWTPMHAWSVVNLQVADLNHDGLDDVLTHSDDHYAAGTLEARYGGGGGWTATGDDRPLIGDLDGDGRPELAYPSNTRLVIVDGTSGRVIDTQPVRWNAWVITTDTTPARLVVQDSVSQAVQQVGWRRGVLTVRASRPFHGTLVGLQAHRGWVWGHTGRTLPWSGAEWSTGRTATRPVWTPMDAKHWTGVLYVTRFAADVWAVTPP